MQLKNELKPCEIYPQKRKKIADTIGKNPEALFDRKNIIFRKFPIALLSLSAGFRHALIGQKRIEFADGEIQILENTTSLKIRGQKFELKS